MTDTHILDQLHALIDTRRDADPGTSYTAKLFAKGPNKIAQKVGEEAVEAVIEAVADDPDALARESADLLFHLLVLWSARGVDPDQVWAKLEARLGTSGLDEKAHRGQG
jgi:phosphoribosyl-ATP pyrophosphohydrolase